MSANTTRHITRREAERTLKNHLKEASDSDLEDMLYSALGRDHLMNFRIVYNREDSDITSEHFEDR